MYTILCCADLLGEKVNLEVTLDAAPVSVQDLVGSLTHIFANEEAALLARQGYGAASAPPFEVASAFIYDDVQLHWSRLKSITQLHEYDQLYVFQPQTQWHHDTQQDLPPPRPPVRSRATSLAGIAGTHAAVPLSSSTFVDGSQQTPVRGFGQPPYSAAGATAATNVPSASRFYGGLANPHRTPANEAASTLSTASRPATRSPVRTQLEEQRREEERLALQLSSVRSERERLERAAQREEDDERRRRAAELDALMQEKEQEMWAHRDALAKAEEAYQQLLAEKQQLMRSISPQ